MIALPVIFEEAKIDFTGGRDPHAAVNSVIHKARARSGG